jgi:hypothetical protein
LKDAKLQRLLRTSQFYVCKRESDARMHLHVV